MLHLRVLGGLDLRDDAGRDPAAALAQPKRVALLAYLAVRAPGSFCRRDTLVAVFWPESDDERARTALRGALHFLRRTLGPEVIRTRGDGDVGVDPAHLRCDASDLVEAAAAGRLEEALALYRGELLDGFHLADAPEFERWLDDERGRLRRLALDAAAALVAGAESRGDLPGAIRAARRGVALAPDDETAARRLIALLDRSGDRAGALRAYDELAARLAAEYETTPSPETRAVVASVRGRAAVDARSDAGPDVRPDVPVAAPRVSAPPAPGAEPEVPTPAPAPTHAPTPAPAPTAPPAPIRTRPWWRRPAVALAAGAATVAVVATWLGASWKRAGTGTSVDVVAVLPFAYHGAPDLAYLGAGLPRLVSANLNGAGQLRTIDPVALARAAGGTAADEGRGRDAAARLGAGLVVAGHVVESGGRVRITATVVRAGAADGSGTPAQVVVDGERGQLFELVDDLTARLVAAWGTERGQRLTSLAARTTRSLPALHAYLDGEREYAAGRYEGAVEAFQRAVAADTGFALAYYRLSSALAWTSRPETYSVAMHARRLVGRLSRRDSLLVEARYANSAGEPDRAEPLYRQVLAEHPDELEAWLQLGEVQFHWAGVLARPAAVAESAFVRALAIDSANVPALVHLARIAGIRGDPARLDSLAARVALLAPGTSEAREAAALRAFVGGTPAERARTAEQIATSRDHRIVRGSASALAAASGDPGAVLPLVRAIDAPDRDLEDRVLARVMEAQLEVARGRWRAAATALDRAATMSPALAAQYAGVFAAAPFLRLDATTLDAVRATLERTRAFPAQHPMVTIIDSLSGVFAARRTYLAARLAVRTGDSATAWRALAAFRPATPLERVDAPMIERRVRAEWAWHRGDAPGALRTLGEPQLPLDTLLPRLSSFATADERWLRAELLAATGRDAEALRWYESFPDPGGYDLIYLAPSHLARARLHERRGERAAAAHHYRRALALWADCDPELRPIVDDARRRLAALGGDPRGAR